MPPKEETPKNKAKSVAGAVIPALAGLATQVGTAVPGLRKPKKLVTASQAALLGGAQVAGILAGQGQQGFGASRALRGREAARAAQVATQTAAGVAGQTALQEQQLYRDQLTQRNKRLADFGAGVADMGANIAQGVNEAKASQAEPAQPEQQAQMQAALPSQAEVAGVNKATGLPTAAPTQTPAPQGPLQLQQPAQGGLQPPQAQQPNLGTPQLQAPQTSPFDTYSAALGLPTHPALRLAPELEYKLRVTNLALEEADRLGVDPFAITARMLRKSGLDRYINSLAQGQLPQL